MSIFGQKCQFWAKFLPLLGQKSIFGGGRALRTLNPKSAFSFIKCGIKDPEKLIYATSIHKTDLSNLTKNEIVLPPMV